MNGYDGPDRRKGQKAVIWLLAAILFVSIVMATTVVVITLSQVRDIRVNTDGVRDANYENCVTANGPIAEAQFQRSLTPPAQTAILVKKLGLDPGIIEKTSIQALQRRLPIFDCSPLLENKAARVMTHAEQNRYVLEFAKGNRPRRP